MVKAILITTPHNVNTTAFNRKKTTANDPVVKAQASESARLRAKTLVSSSRIWPVIS